MFVPSDSPLPALHEQHPMQPFWRLAASAVQAEALALALETGLLDRLATPHTAAEAAEAQGWHAANTGHCLELLWSMGVLERSDAPPPAQAYRLSADAQRYLHSGSDICCAGAWLFRLRSLRHACTLLREQLVHGPQGQGSPAPFASGSPAGWAAAARAQIGQEQRAVTVQAALAVLRCVPEVAEARWMLDLGGGPGEVALALARLLPALHATVYDGPETAAVAAENAERAGLAHRVRTRSGDLAQDRPDDGIGGGYDLVWCSSVLHFVPDAAAVLRKVFDALEPGGVFVCAHAEVAATPEAAVRTLPYYLPMRMLGRNVTREGELEARMADAGFERIERLESQAFPMAPLAVLVARRPGRAGAGEPVFRRVSGTA